MNYYDFWNTKWNLILYVNPNQMYNYLYVNKSPEAPISGFININNLVNLSSFKNTYYWFNYTCLWDTWSYFIFQWKLQLQ